MQRSDTNESDMIRHLKQNIIQKSQVSSNMDSSFTNSRFSESRKNFKVKNVNNHSVFRFNKFENEQRSKI